MNYKTLAIIPARGGSKRIPRKNIKEFLGQPIISYSIDVASKSNLFQEIMVSTDDHEIAEISKKYGAKIPFFRSKENSSDLASTTDVLTEVIKKYKEIGIEFDYACCIYPASPLITVEALRTGFEFLNEKNFDVSFPVCKFANSIWKAFTIDDDELKMLWPENELSRTQDLKKAFYDAGQFYWFNVDKFLSTGQLFPDRTGGIVLDELAVQDIDTNSDWKIAEIKYKLLHGIL